MQYIQTLEQIDWKSMQSDIVLAVPVLSDHLKHRCENRISFIYFYNFNTHAEFVVGCNHSDLNKNGEEWIAATEFPKLLICYNKSVLWQHGVQCYDADMCFWLYKNIPIEVEYSPDITVYHRWYDTIRNVNDIVPIVNLIEWCKTIKQNFKECIYLIEFDRTLEFYNNIVLENFYTIENAGLPIDREALQRHFNIDRECLYTQYFPYTATGRPSNRYGGINFAALNKTSGVREIISVQNDSQLLIEFDYDSHHVRLVANLIGYNLPEGNLHHYFGRQYFNTPVLTDEQYHESKIITFKLLYGSQYSGYSDIPFFNKVTTYIDKLWKEYNEHGFVVTPLSNRKIYSENMENMNPSKLFNYILQGYETDVNSIMLNKVLRYLYTKQSRLILYTYDSFLFLYSKHDGKDFIRDISRILNNFNMLTSFTVGTNYSNMIIPKNRLIHETTKKLH